MTRPPPLRVGMVGYAFMGAAHAHAWRTVNRFFDLPLRAELAVVCGRDEARTAAAADRLGFAGYRTDWREMLARDDVDLVDICTPGDSHAEIAVAALDAGKHVLCEKPLANSVAQARDMAAAADQARAGGIRSMVGFNYRRAPAIAFLRQLVADQRLGTLRHVRAVYLQDWIVDPDFPLVWRLRREHAGSGALGDLGAHLVDLAGYLTGQRIRGVTAMAETFVTERPLPAQASGLAGGLAGAGEPGTARGPVTVDDAVAVLARMSGGALATFEATRFATGHRNGLRFELNGDRGSAVWDVERLNELAFHDADRPDREQGFTRILVTEPGHPYLAAWWPPGHVLGYEHTFTHEVRDLIEAIAAGTDPEPSFAAGLGVQLVLDAVERSVRAGSSWTAVSDEEPTA